MIRRARAAEGAAWFVDSFRMAGRCWRVWWPASVLCTLCGWIVLQLPLVGWVLALPLNCLLAGFMMGLGRNLESGDGGLRATWRQMPAVAGRLLRLGGLAFAAGLAVLAALAALAWCGLDLLDLTGRLPAAPPEFDRYGRFLVLIDGMPHPGAALRGLFLALILVVLAGFLILLPLFWLAPARMALAGAGLRRALADSWTACWRNMWPMCLCALLLAVGGFIVQLFCAFALGLAGFDWPTVGGYDAGQLLISLLYISPLGYLALYITHREVFAPKPTDSAGG